MIKHNRGNQDEPPLINRIISRIGVYLGLDNYKVLPVYNQSTGWFGIPVWDGMYGFELVGDCGSLREQGLCASIIIYIRSRMRNILGHKD